MFGKSILSQNLGFDGKLDDVRIWDRALSAEEVASLVPEPTTSALALAALCLVVSRRRSLRINHETPQNALSAVLGTALSRTIKLARILRAYRGY